jgi:plastocyanin
LFTKGISLNAYALTQISPASITSLIIVNIFICAISATCCRIAVTVTDASGVPLSNAVVYAEPIGKPVAKSTATATAFIEQKNKTFIPLVSAVQSGSNISFPNRDLVRHHVYSFSPAKTFELKLYSGIPANPVLFDTAGTVVLGCNIHDTMLAYIHIVDTPYFAKTDESGKVKPSDLPMGQYHLKVWHYATLKENLISEQNVNVKGAESVQFKLEVKNK